MAESLNKSAGTSQSGRRRLVLILAVVGALCLTLLVMFHEVLIGNYLRARLLDTVETKYPQYTLSIDTLRYNMFRGQLDFDHIALGSVESAVAWNVQALSMDGISLLSLISGNAFVEANLGDVTLEAFDIRGVFPNTRYALQCHRFLASAPDSLIEVDSLLVHPIVDDKTFFSAREYRQSRYDVSIPGLDAHGVDCVGLVFERRLSAAAIHMADPTLEILVNRDKESAPDTSTRRAPQESLAALERELRIENLNVTSGALRYAEQIHADSAPAVLLFDQAQISVQGITSRPDSTDTAIIVAEAVFMHAGQLSLNMTIPLQSKGYSLHTVGALTAMDLTRLNEYLELAAQKRIRGGKLYSASFEIEARSGNATGLFQAHYDDLDIQHLEGRNVVKELAIFMFHKFKLRKSNLPKDGKPAKVGEVSYIRKPSDSFFRFLWFSIRSGLGDIMGLH